MITSSASQNEPKIKKAELQLTDIADAVQDDWVALARQLGLSDEEIVTISTDYTYSSEQALVMLHLWVDRFGADATGNELQRALRRIGRQDVTTTCMSSVRVVTDEREWKAAQQQLDEEFKGEQLSQHRAVTSCIVWLFCRRVDAGRRVTSSSCINGLLVDARRVARRCG